MVNKDRLFNRLMELGQIGNTEDGVYCMALHRKRTKRTHRLRSTWKKPA